jgi:pyruvate kinase
MPLRRTKIVATLGPATDKPKVLKRLIEAGVDAARLNYSHGTHEDQARRTRAVRRAAKSLNQEIAVIADLQGPKIRIERFRNGPIELEEGDEFIIDADLGANEGDEQHVGVTYKDLPRDVHRGDTLLIDEGRIMLQVEKIDGNAIETVVLLGGKSHARGHFSAPVLGGPRTRAG